MDSAKDVLASKGEKLHVHETNVRRIRDGKFLVTHQMRDKHGHPPSDGQSEKREHSMDNIKDLLAHIQANQPQADDQQEQPDAQTDAQAGAPPAGQ
jgi:hypothetical protein